MVSVLWLMRDDFSRFFKSCKKKWWVPGDWYYWQIRVLGWVSIRSERSIDTIFPLYQSGIQQKKEHLHVSHFPLRAREASFWWFIEKGFSVCQSLWIWALCSHLHIFRHVGLLCWETQWFITSPTRLPCEAVSFTVSFICVTINTIAWVLLVCLNANSVCFFSPVFMEQATMQWHKGLSFWFDM